MSQLLSTKSILISLLILLLVSACQSGSAPTNEMSYTSSYEQALEKVSGSPISQAEADVLTQRFAALYSNIENPEFDAALANVYAETLYFNDTMHEFAHRAQLGNYLAGLTDQVDSLTLEPKAVMLHPNGREFWVNWAMDFELTIGGQYRLIRSYGMSQFRVNEAGLINFHQDYWDPNNGLYRSLPYVGGLYRSAVPFKPLSEASSIE